MIANLDSANVKQINSMNYLIILRYSIKFHNKNRWSDDYEAIKTLR